MILVSACLLGINCKYNGDNNKNEKVEEYLKDKQFILVCPEQLGGLTTPREPSEIIKLDGNGVIDGITSVINNKRLDVTKQFKKVNRLLNNVETADTEESLTAQMIYSELKELQEMVAPHVIDYDSFIHEYEYDDYFNEGNDIEYYD
jgi:uncharacterized protein YbbK (DUF523 family)